MTASCYEIGVPHQTSNSTSMTSFGRVAKISFDPAANEAFLADGYSNHRVAVIDMDNGKIKRFWGAYGNEPVRQQPRPLRSRRPAGPAVPHPGPLRRADATTGWCMSATGPTTGSRSSGRTAAS